MWFPQPAVPAPRKRGRPVKVPAQWLATIRAYWEDSGKTLAKLGEELAVIMGAPEPFSPRRVHEYIHGKTTDEMTRAWATLMNVAPPVVGVDDPRLLEWLEVGRRLLAQTPDRFGDELAAISELVEALEQRSPRK